MYPKNTIEDFWHKVDKNGPNGCWNWTCSLHKGYGHFRIDGKIVMAHRYSLELALGRPIAYGLQALHKCKQNRKCVNPDHLYEGTHRQNMQDKVRDGTGNQPKGELHKNSKLTQDAIKEIRILRGFGFTLKEMGKIYAVSDNTIRDMLVGNTWN